MSGSRILSQDDLKSRREAAEALHQAKALRVSVCCGASCIASGALEVKSALETRLIDSSIEVTTIGTGCMGPCSRGPLVRVEPDGVVYDRVTPEDTTIILARHFGSDEVPGDTVPAATPAESLCDRQERIVLRNAGLVDPSDISDSIRLGAYSALAKAVCEMSDEQVIDEMKKAGLRGRGGAGFPTWLKWSLARGAEGEQKYVVCNADEGDPGAFMDRSVLEGDPHSLIEGMAIAARAIGASRGYVYVRAEYPLAVERLTIAIGQARENGLLGNQILGSEFCFDLEIRMGSGAFVCGEETALIHSIEGKRGEPRPRPPFPVQRGLWEKPTVLNNVETYANVAAIIGNGAQWFSQFGTPESRGTKVFALAGAVENTGLVEVPIGTTLGELVFDIGGGVKGGRPFKAAQIGGPSGGCVPRQYLNVPLDYEALKELGAIMGSGGLIVMDDETCMVDVARFFLEFVQEESCGKCTPCRVGTKRMLEILNRICAGQGEEGDIERLLDLGKQIQDTALCGLGQTAPNPVLSTIRHFRSEYEAHIRERHCDAGVCPGLVRAPCQSACPAGVDVPGFVALIGEKRYAEALALHRERNPFAAVCARVCFHTCEDHCRRAAIDAPVAIRALKRHMVDHEIVIQLPSVQESPENAAKKVAIIGAGPAGLSCAYFLARLGYRPLVLEAEERPGGMLVQTIPAYRLPRETLAREIRMIEQLGVTIETGKRLGREFTLDTLREQGYEAIFLGVGAPQCMGLGVPGEDADGVVYAGAFLKQYNTRGSVPVGGDVVVVGGGNAAIDAARTALRLGAKNVSIVYRRTREQMPAYEEEIQEAVAEGVELHLLSQPTEVRTNKDGSARALLCQKMTLGEFDRSGRRRPTAGDGQEFELAADQVIVAIGQTLELAPLLGDLEVARTSNGFVEVDRLTGQSSVRWLFGGGDATSGPDSVVGAIAGGERAAVGIDLLLSGSSHAFWRRESTIDTDYDPQADPVPYPREPVRTIAVDRRRHNFDEVEQPWCEAVAMRQAGRCLRCDYGKSCAAPVEPNREELHV